MKMKEVKRRFTLPSGDVLTYKAQLPESVDAAEYVGRFNPDGTAAVPDAEELGR
jgi:hypothetical protein